MRQVVSGKAARKQAISRFDVDDLAASEFAQHEGFAAASYLFGQAEIHWRDAETDEFDDAVDALEDAVVAEADEAAKRTIGGWDVDLRRSTLVTDCPGCPDDADPEARHYHLGMITGSDVSGWVCDVCEREIQECRDGKKRVLGESEADR